MATTSNITKISKEYEDCMSSSSMAKLSKNEIVSLEVFIKICSVLNCNIGDIMDVINEVKVEVHG